LEEDNPFGSSKEFKSPETNLLDDNLNDMDLLKYENLQTEEDQLLNCDI
jgi:hypothetical protein